MKAMTMLNKRFLPLIVADFKLAIAHTTVWLFLLWASGHPLEEWAITSLVLYIALWASKEIVLRLGLFALRRQSEYGKRIMRKAGVEISENPSAKRSFGARLLSTSVILLMFAVAVGASLSLGIPGAALLGVTPLAHYFSWIGWALLGVGLAGLSLFFIIAWLAFAMVDNLVDSLNESSGREIAGFYETTERVAAFAGIAR